MAEKCSTLIMKSVIKLQVEITAKKTAKMLGKCNNFP